MISEYKIHRFIKERGQVTMEELLDALAVTEEHKKEVEDKVRMMQRFDLVNIDLNGEIKLKKIEKVRYIS